MARRKTTEYYDQKKKERDERVAFEKKLRLAYEARVDAQTQTENLDVEGEDNRAGDAAEDALSLSDEIDGQIVEGKDNRAGEAAEDALSLSDGIPLLETEEEMASLTSRTKKEKKEKGQKRQEIQEKEKQEE